MTEQFIRDRITQLRINKNVSEYKMSYDLGHSKGYIQSISSGRAMPSMSEFLYICEYLGVTPQQFFAEDISNPVQLQTAIDLIAKLNDEDLQYIIALAERLNNA